MQQPESPARPTCPRCTVDLVDPEKCVACGCDPRKFARDVNLDAFAQSAEGAEAIRLAFQLRELLNRNKLTAFPIAGVGIVDQILRADRTDDGLEYSFAIAASPAGQARIILHFHSRRLGVEFETNPRGAMTFCHSLLGVVMHALDVAAVLADKPRTH